MPKDLVIGDIYGIAAQPCHVDRNDLRFAQLANANGRAGVRV